MTQSNAPEPQEHEESSSQITAQIETAVDTLPLWAALALGARSIRRVLPLLSDRQEGDSGETAHELEKAMQFVETGLLNDESGADIVLDLKANRYSYAQEVIVSLKQSGDELEDLRFREILKSLEYAIGATLIAFSNSAAQGVPEQHWKFKRQVRKSIESVLDAAPKTRELIRRDAVAIREAADKNGWTHSDRVNPYLFGPYWDESPPGEWNSEAREAAIKFDRWVAKGDAVRNRARTPRRDTRVDETDSLSEAPRARNSTNPRPDERHSGARPELDIDKLKENTLASYSLLATVTRHAEDTERRVDAMLENARIRLKKLESDYVETRAIEDAEHHWQKRCFRHRVSFWVWAVLTLLTAVAGCAGLFLVFIRDVTQSLSSQEGIINYYYVGIGAFSAAMIGLLVKVMTRITLSSLHLANDAEERVVMTSTYLKLIQDKHLARKRDLKLVIQNLFRPTTTGLVKEDVVPASLLDLASRLAQDAYEPQKK